MDLHGSGFEHLNLLGEFLHLKCRLVVLVDVLIDALNHKVLAVLEFHQPQEGLERSFHGSVLKRLVSCHFLCWLEIGGAQIALTGLVTTLLGLLGLLSARTVIICPPG